jgi:hypothetical protein
MQTTTLEGISRELGATTTRRGAFRFLGSAAALGVVAAIGHDDAQGKRKKKAKKKAKTKVTPPTGVCTPGAEIARITVPYTGVAVLTPVLTAGQVYRVQVSGAAPTNATHSVDAEYDFLTATPATFADNNATVDVGLSIDDATTDLSKSPKWGPYNPAHIYEQQIVGQGRPASLLMQDSVYGDNSGAVTVVISCGAR